MNEVLALSLITAMAAISSDYWIQAVLIKDGHAFSVKQDMLTFVASIITSLLATGAVILFLMRESNRLYGKLSLGVAAGLALIWTVITILYITRQSISSSNYC